MILDLEIRESVIFRKEINQTLSYSKSVLRCGLNFEPSGLGGLLLDLTISGPFPVFMSLDIKSLNLKQDRIKVIDVSISFT